MTKAAPLNLANQSTYNNVPESTILKLLFDIIKSNNWKEYSFVFKFTGRKSLSGKGFEAHGFSIESPKKKELPENYKSPTEKALKRRQDFFEAQSRRAKLGGAKGGAAHRVSKKKEVEL